MRNVQGRNPSVPRGGWAPWGPLPVCLLPNFSPQLQNQRRRGRANPTTPCLVLVSSEAAEQHSWDQRWFPSQKTSKFIALWWWGWVLILFFFFLPFHTRFLSALELFDLSSFIDDNVKCQWWLFHTWHCKTFSCKNKQKTFGNMNLDYSLEEFKHI